MVAAQAGSPVLILGDLGARLQLELQSAGMTCTVVPNANEAVARMKATRFPVVIVPPVLADMGGVDFIHGVLRHFDANVVLYGNGVEANEINALLRTGRVAHFPAHAEGHVVADFLARSSQAGQAGQAARNGTPNAAPGVATQPPAPKPGTQFNLTPGPPPTTPPTSMPPTSNPPTPVPPTSLPPMGQSALSAALFGTGSPGSLSNAQTQFGGTFPPTAQFPSNTFPAGAFPPGAFQSSSFPPSPSSFPPTGAPGFAVTPSGGMPAFAPRPPTLGPSPGLQQPPQFEVMVDELARANSELLSLRNKIAASDQERAALIAEVEAARRSAMNDVAQVMALSDEGDPIADELAELKSQVEAAKAEYALARAEADALREDRARLMADAAKHSGELAELRAQATAAEIAVAETALVRTELEGKTNEVDAVRSEVESVKIERNAIMKELEVVRGERDVARSDIEAVRNETAQGIAQARDLLSETEKERDDAVVKAKEIEKERDESSAELDRISQRVAVLETQRAELASALAEAQKNPGKSDVEAALRTELDKVRADVAAARTDATTVRLDLQEALMRLDESGHTLEALTSERDALRAEAVPLREWATQLVNAQKEQQKELDQARAVAGYSASAQQSIAEIQKQLEAVQAERDKLATRAASGGGDGEAEVLLARSRQLADLVRALEPFMWGLTQATTFYTKAGIGGGDQHLKLLQQLQGVLLRLRDEIAMLDLG